MSRHAQYMLGAVAQTVKQLVDGQPDFVEVTTPSSTSDELEIAHGLGRVPKGVLVVKSTINVQAYDSGTPWTDKYLYCKFTQADQDVTVAVL